MQIRRTVLTESFYNNVLCFQWKKKSDYGLELEQLKTRLIIYNRGRWLQPYLSILGER